MNRIKNRFVLGFVLGMLSMTIAMAGIFAGMTISFNESGGKTVSTSTKDKINDIERIISKYYLGEYDKEKLSEGVYKGLMSGLGDPYSTYYTAEEYRQLLEENSGKYTGVGMLVSQNAKTGTITVIQSYEGSPAHEAGILAGDVLYKVEDREVTGLDINQVVDMIKGEEGTKVKIQVYRSKTDDYLDFQVERKKISVPTVSHRMIDKKNKIGYIQISQFEEVTYDQFVQAITELKRNGMKSVIFDLRNNPGGLYDTVCRMLDYILPEGTLVSTKDKNGKEQVRTSDAACLDMPMVVLQNENSASASEIFAGAVQDFKVGKIVGTKSFGKGIVQTYFKLNDDGSAIKITIENYYTPSGRNIHGKGIEPDVEVNAEADAKKDLQLNKATEVIKAMMNK